MKTIIAAAIMAVTGQAATFTYTWVPDTQPPTRPGFHRVIAAGTFVVKDSAIVAGVITPGDVLALDFKMSTPANFFYKGFDSGSFAVDPTTGVILSGAMHAVDPVSTYGRGANFTAGRVYEDNVAGGAWSGHWRIDKAL